MQKKFQLWMAVKKPSISYYVAVTFSLFALFFVLFVTALSCDKDKQVLATYKDGKITREQLRMFFELSQGIDSPNKAPTEMQNKLLLRYALIQLAADASKDSKPSEDSEYKKRLSVAEKRAQLLAYEYLLRQNSKKEKHRMLELQALFLTAKPAVNPAINPVVNEALSLSSRKEEAEEILSLLNQGQIEEEEVEKIIFEKSEHQRYALQSGYIEPQCISCSFNSISHLTDPLKNLKKEEERKFILIERPEGFWIIRKYNDYLADSEELFDRFKSFYRRNRARQLRNIAKLSAVEKKQPFVRKLQEDQPAFDDKARQRSERIVVKERENLLGKKLEKLKEEQNYRLYEEGNINHPTLSPVANKPNAEKSAYKEDTALFSLNGKDYTYGMLKQELEHIPSTENVAMQSDDKGGNKAVSSNGVSENREGNRYESDKNNRGDTTDEGNKIDEIDESKAMNRDDGENDGKDDREDDGKKIAEIRTNLHLAQSVVLPSLLLAGDPDYKKVVESDFYKFTADLLKKDAASYVYYQEKLPKGAIPEEKLKEEFSAGENTIYRGKSFSAVKPYIEQRLQRERQQQSFEKIQNDLIEQYALDIKTELLEADKL